VKGISPGIASSFRLIQTDQNTQNKIKMREQSSEQQLFHVQQLQKSLYAANGNFKKKLNTKTPLK
jgi:hypothetical protein